MKTKDWKKVGYILTPKAIEMLTEIAKDYRNNKSVAVEEAIKFMFNSKITKDENSSK